MENMNFVVNLQSKADKSFENIKESIRGLYQILKILSNNDENDIFCKMGLDNIESIYQNLLELLFNDYGARQLIKKLKNSDEEFLTIDLEE